MSTQTVENIEAGGFFCGACLVDKPYIEQSPDDRYCQGCYEFLENEAEMISPGSRPGWIPKSQTKPTQAKIEGKNLCPISQDTNKQKEVLVHTETVTSHAYQNLSSDRPKTSVGGRPKKDVPTELIHKLSNEGMSIKGIVKALKEQGQAISAMTVSRVISGERKEL